MWKVKKIYSGFFNIKVMVMVDKLIEGYIEMQRCIDSSHADIDVDIYILTHIHRSCK